MSRDADRTKQRGRVAPTDNEQHTKSGERQTRLRSPLIIGHRGASARAPENTLIAFELAMLDGADGFEFDVRLAQDFVPVVIHDATLRRTAGRVGSIAGLSSDELGQVDVGSWFNRRFRGKSNELYAQARVPSLAQVFELFQTSPARFYIEMKCELNEVQRLAAEVARLVQEYSFIERAIVESFELGAVKEIKRIHPMIRTAALFQPIWSRPRLFKRTLISRAIDCGADEIALHHILATRRTVAAATEQGLRTVVWTVDKPAWVSRALDYGIDALITNDPAKLRAVLNEPSGSH